nr:MULTISPECIES: pyridoxamine 5'-phosphate oxidase family protein [Rhodomicrobium]
MSSHSSAEWGLILASARGLMRMAGVASLATLECGTGAPYASLITAATETDGSPIMLISKLAWHTRNLEADDRASILFSAQAGGDDPLNLGRVSLMGRAERTSEPRARARFLARHPSAALYADFADFSFWRLKVERAHYVGGFGRITTLEGGDVLLGPAAARAWDADVDSAIEAVNSAHAELVARLAPAGASAQPHPWRVAACDPDGCEIAAGDYSHRLAFPAPISAPAELSAALFELFRRAA